MRKTVISISILFFIANLYAQSGVALYGFVYEQNSGKKPVKGVMVKAGFANQIATTDKGSYTLTFQNAAPGKAVVLAAEKEAWIITDKDKLAVNLPDDPFTHPHVIVMCREDVWKKQNEHNRKLIDSILQVSYNKQKAALNKQGKNYQKLLDSLTERFTQSETRLTELADVMSRTNLDEVSEIEKKAYRLFQEGKMDECIQLRESLESEKNFLKTVKELNQIDSLHKVLDTAKAKKIERKELDRRNIKELARLAQLDFDFKSAETKLAFLAINDSTDLNSVFDYAYFLQQQNQHDKAIVFYKRVLVIVKTELGVATTQNNLGNLYAHKNDYTAAEKAYLEALAIRKRFAKGNPAAYEPDVATVQNNLGVLYAHKNDYASAEKAYLAALEIYKRFAKNNPAAYEPKVASLQDNLGILYADKNDYVAAEQAYLEALAIRKRFAKGNPAAYEPDVASVQNNLGILYKRKNDYVSAEQAYLAALEIYKRFAKNNPAAYESDVALTQTNLGVLYADKNDDVAAEQAYLEALAIRKRVAKNNPAAYEPDVASMQNNLGILYKRKNDYVSAEQAYLEAIDLYKIINKRSPEIYQFKYCKTIILLGELYTVYHQPLKLAEYKSISKNADSILTKSVDDNPTITNLKKRQAELSNFFLASDVEIKILRNQLKVLKNNKDKLLLQQQIIDKRRLLLKEGHKEFIIALANDLGELSWYLILDRKYIPAEQTAKEAIFPTILNKPDDYEKETEWINANLALALLLQDKYGAAEKIYLAFKDKAYRETTFKKPFLDDLDELEKAGITHKDIVKIRELLNK